MFLNSVSCTLLENNANLCADRAFFLNFVWLSSVHRLTYTYIHNTHMYTYTYISTCIYGIQHWRTLRSSYRKFAWVEFEPTITEFRSDDLTDWANRPWVQLALRENFVQSLQLHLFVQCSFWLLSSTYIYVYTDSCCHISRRNQCGWG